MSPVMMGLQGVPMVKSSGAAVPALRLSAGSRGHRRAALVVLCASALIVNVDNTILNVALPVLVRKLAATSSELQWIVDSYAMVFAGLLIAWRAVMGAGAALTIPASLSIVNDLF